MYHGEEASNEAESTFEKVIVDKEIPETMPEFAIDRSPCRIDDLLIHTKTADSKSNARRLIQQGGVSVNGKKVSDPFAAIPIDSEIILKVGKRKFAKISLKR
jgi:tyrosyl-tRNA synthetase